MRQVVQPLIAIRGHHSPRPIAAARCRKATGNEWFAILYYRIFNHVRATVYVEGFPQGFTFDTTWGGERSCELFRGISLLNKTNKNMALRKPRHPRRVQWRFLV
jgi:hypothetical protein